MSILPDTHRKCLNCEEVAPEEEGEFDPSGEWLCGDCYDIQAAAAIGWCEAVLTYRAMKDLKAEMKVREIQPTQPEWLAFHAKYRKSKGDAWKAEEEYRLATGRSPFMLRDRQA